MRDEGLYLLYKLHLIDAALYDLKQHAAALDVGKEESAKIKALETLIKPVKDELAQVQRETEETETAQKADEEKLARYEKQLYDGSITNSREVENVQKEIEMLTGLVITLDDKATALRGQAKPLRDKVKQAEAKVAELRQAGLAKQEAAKAEHARLEAEYKQAAAKRPDAAKAVDPGLLRTYEAVRAKTGNTAMATVTPQDRCQHCGMHVPEKALDAIRSGRPAQCEQCRRILFIVVPEA
ncbi:MAG: hypothetical protein KF857_11000 [Fimbriimonadaceae bacterium]|nr:hypothetical protein [Fimbriimonadaceae bacterium]